MYKTKVFLLQLGQTNFLLLLSNEYLNASIK
jgi:hypothetical protein